MFPQSARNLTDCTSKGDASFLVSCIKGGNEKRRGRKGAKSAFSLGRSRKTAEQGWKRRAGGGRGSFPGEDGGQVWLEAGGWRREAGGGRLEAGAWRSWPCAITQNSGRSNWHATSPFSFTGTPKPPASSLQPVSSLSNAGQACRWARPMTDCHFSPWRHFEAGWRCREGNHRLRFRGKVIRPLNNLSVPSFPVFPSFLTASR
jgi:hypothetical protein